MKTHCPKCGSDQWKMLSVLYSEGKSVNKGKFSGIGTFGIGFGSTFSQIETELSKIASPPYPSPLFLGIGLAIMLAGATVGMHYKISFLVYAGVVIGSLFVITAIISNSVKLSTWRKTAMCAKCGTQFN